MTAIRSDAPLLLSRLAAIVGEAAVVTDATAMSPYLAEPRDLYHGRALCVLKPSAPQEVASILALCNETGASVTPQGGNTGLVGGQTPDASGASVVLSLEKLNRIRAVDATADAMTVEAGVTLSQAQDAAQAADRYFPLSLASEGSCTIGGNLATNAGGVHVLAYGSMRDLVLGVEVALADGRLLSTLGALRKDNTGYDLTRLFVGSEGTLGVITAATLKLFPAPRSHAVAFLGLRDPAQALLLLNFVKGRAGPMLNAFELVSRQGLELVLRHIPATRDPLAQPHDWYALIELAAFADGEAERAAADILAAAIDAALAQDATLAQSLDQARALWKLRESLSESQKREGGSIKHDIAVPVNMIPRFIEEAGRRLSAAFPLARPVPFGHMGDGNIHYNVSQPVGADKAEFIARWAEVNAIVHGVVHEFGGSISAEHGIGRLKRDLLRETKDPVALDAMRAIKAALDPNGILNPGVLL
ncbi:FAD-binding oxidoreductase [Methylocystis hirsuta]|uniref:FAD-binding oxidoreductase n=1 Tax=Methylocystis hirsuta TaxID=369798 RepID=A0A3M9XKQ7_9HYPH|nr:FAD-binding oxidoreductase [Methylocystis hirsuta]RNJ48356.1 FAD-binding oxidoreductase [Methylocystis hirsuta]